MLTKEMLVNYLKKVDESFPVPLSKKVDLTDYANKLSTKATLCYEIWNEESIGLVAGYTEKVINEMAYIALVGVVEEAQHEGIASKLVKEFCIECSQKGLKKVHLYTDSRNERAILMYKKLGFKEYIIEDEPRPKDIHFILDIK